MLRRVLQSLSVSHGEEKRAAAWAGGLLFAFVFAGLGYGLALLPGLDRVGSLIMAILLAVIWRQAAGYPEAVRPGITFASKTVLRAAIILYGFRLDIGEVVQRGLGMLLLDAAAVLLGTGLVWWLGRRMGADSRFSLLLGAGTGICGAAAIAAVAPVLDSREEETAMGVGIIALSGTVFALLYTVLLPFLPMTPEQFGIWTGLSLHEIAHVAAAASPAGSEVLTVALMAKLGRVLLLVPFSFLLAAALRRGKGKKSSYRGTFPWFLLGFVLTSLAGSFLPIPSLWLEWVTHLGTFLLAAGMVGLGLNVQLRGLRGRALIPMAAVAIASVILSLGMAGLTLLVW